MFTSLFLVPSLSLSPWLVLYPLLLLQTALDCVVHVPIKRVHCISAENVCQSTLTSILNSLTAFIPSILISTVTFTDTTNKGLTCSNSNSSSLVTAVLILSCINVIKILTNTGDYIPAQRIASLPDAHISLKVCSKVYLLVNSVMPTSEEREANSTATIWLLWYFWCCVKHDRCGPCPILEICTYNYSEFYSCIIIYYSHCLKPQLLILIFYSKHLSYNPLSNVPQKVRQ